MFVSKARVTGLTILCLLFLTSCTTPWTAVTPPSVSGASYAVLGSYLYRIGGQTAEGSWSNQTWCAPLTSGTIGAWVRGPDLPIGRAWAAVAAADGYLNIAGGENASGPLSDVYSGYVDPAGQGIPGFLNAAGQPEWTRAPYNLPYPVSRAASVVANGRWYLLGGQSTAASPITNALSAAILMDGSLGGWHLHPQFLSVPTWGASAFSWNSLLVSAGGETPTGFAPTQVWQWTGSWQAWTPLASTNTLLPIFYDAGTSLNFGSGYTGTQVTTTWWGLSTQGLTTSVFSLGQQPTFSQQIPTGQQILARTSQTLISPDAQDRLQSVAWVPAACPSPVIFPVSGQITVPNTPRLDPLPGCQIHYTWTPLGQAYQTPTSISPVWDPLHPLVVSGSGRLAAIQTLIKGSESSRETDADYTALSLGFTLTINQTLSSSPAYKPQTIASDSVGTPGLDTWFQLTLYVPVIGHLGLQDASNGPWTAHLTWSLLEQDEVTPVLDSQDRPLSNQGPGDYPGLVLYPGRYLLHVISMDGQTGASFGLLWEYQ
ncbi:MAG: hypothetical protein HKM05_12210 [Spirochaetales bacterium]|nr:hypothetical protein [Spirochaetales bacterium]